MKYTYYYIIFMLWIITTGYFYAYYLDYGIPFGKSDVDNYLCFLGIPYKTYEKGCGHEVLSFSDDFIHYPFVGVVRFFGVNPVLTLSLLIPFVLCLVIPLLYLLIGVSYYNDVDDGVGYALLMIFGCFNYFIFGWWSVWSQMFSFVFYLLALNEILWGVGKDKRILYVCILLSVVFHPYIMVVWLLFGLAYVIDLSLIHI